MASAFGLCHFPPRPPGSRISGYPACVARVMRTPPNIPSDPAHFLLALLFLAGAGAGIHLQVLSGHLVNVLGPGDPAAASALAAFFLAASGGLWFAAEPSEKSARPLGVLAALQMLAALLSLAVHALLHKLDSNWTGLWLSTPQASGIRSFLAFFTGYLITLPAGAVFGASLAAAVPVLHRRGGIPTALALALTPVFFGLAVGFPAGQLFELEARSWTGNAVAAFLQGIAAALAAAASWLHERHPQILEAAPSSPAPAPPSDRTFFLAALVAAVAAPALFLAGRLVAYALEADGRGLAGIHAALLGCLGLGSLAASPLLKRSRSLQHALGLGLAAAAFGLTASSLAFSHALSGAGFTSRLAALEPTSFRQALHDAGAAVLPLLLPAVAFGPLLPSLAGLARERGHPHAAAGSGILAAASLGCASGLALYTLLVSLAGLQGGIALAAAALAALAATQLARRPAWALPPAVLLLYVFLEPPPLPPHVSHPGLQTREYRETPSGPYHALGDAQDPVRIACHKGYPAVRLDRADPHPVFDHLALSLSSEPRTVLMLGFDPHTAAEILSAYPSVTRIRARVPSPAFEPAMLRAFDRALRSRSKARNDPVERLVLEAGELVPFLLAGGEKWPIILAHLEWQPGPAAKALMMSGDLLHLARECLTAAGLLAFALPATLPPDVFADSLDAFAREFPDGQIWAFEPHEVVLLGGPAPIDVRLDVFEEHLAQWEVQNTLQTLHLHLPEALLGSRVCDAARWKRLRREEQGPPSDPWTRRRDLARFESGRIREDWRQSNLARLAAAVDPQPIPIETRDYSLSARLLDYTGGLKFLLEGLSQAPSESDLSAARKTFERGTDGSPGDIRLAALLQRCRGERPGSAGPGRARQAVGPTEATPDASSGWQESAALGEAAFNRGDYARALFEYRKAEQAAPGQDEPRFAVALALSRLGRHEEAAERFRALWRASPTLVEAGINLGFSLGQLGRWPEAETCYREILIRSAHHEVVHYNLATALREMNRIEEAIEEYQAALSLKPEYPEAIYDLAILFYREQEYFQALPLLRKFETLAPRTLQAREARRLIGVLEHKQQKP
ncbi:MAG: tetratricopeptide repeat protein [Planctomycetes bacterium]|nr:tetratricopeptide repeat protein [Planctomycetota bacterium]